MPSGKFHDVAVLRELEGRCRLFIHRVPYAANSNVRYVQHRTKIRLVLRMMRPDRAGSTLATAAKSAASGRPLQRPQKTRKAATRERTKSALPAFLPSSFVCIAGGLGLLLFFRLLVRGLAAGVGVFFDDD